MTFRLRDYPRQIDVGDAIWSVRFVRHIPHHKPGRVCLGLAEPSEQVIYIKLGQGPQERLKTFVHEVLHAFEYEFEFEMPHRLISRLEEPIARFVVDNFLGK